MNNIIQKIVEIISEMLPEVIVEHKIVLKNNGVIKNGISIHKPEEQINPTIYIDAKLESGHSAENIAEYVVSEYGIHDKPERIQQACSNIIDYERIKEHLGLWLINKQMNIHLFDTIPYKEFLDLAVITIIDLPCENNVALIKVNYKLLDYWEKSFDDVYAQAMKNFKKERTVITNIDTIIKSSYLNLLDWPLYILSNKKNLNGATRIMDEDALRDFAETFDTDIVLFPSSVHEFLLVPTDSADVDESFNQIVRDVNQSEVIPEEYLSDHVYIYRLNGGWIENKRSK